MHVVYQEQKSSVARATSTPRRTHTSARSEQDMLLCLRNPKISTTSEANPRCQLCASTEDGKRVHVFTLKQSQSDKFKTIVGTVAAQIEKGSLNEASCLELRDKLLASSNA
jgi:hypothetical protein